MDYHNRGDVWLADLSPTGGHEQAGLRPVMVISVDGFNNGPADIVVILPVTKVNRNILFHITVTPPESGLDNTSYIMCDQIRAISKDRLIKRSG